MPVRTESTTVDPKRLIEAHREAVRFYRGRLIDQYVGWPREHLVSRRLDHVLEPDSRWKVGYAPGSWTALVEHLRRRGFHAAELDASGLVIRTHNGSQVDRFRDRIMFPIRNPTGDPVGFIGRARPDTDVPRYLNTPGTAVYRKGECLFGLAEQRDHLSDGAQPVIVEGPTDVLAVDTATGPAPTIRAAVAACGTALTVAQVDLLRRVSRSNSVLVATDADLGGVFAAEHAYKLLEVKFRTVLMARLPERTDPADIAAGRGGAAALRTLLGQPVPMARFLIEAEVARWRHVLDHIDGQVGAVRAVAPLVARLPRTQVASEVTWLADHVGLDHDLVTSVVVDAITTCATSACRVPAAVSRTTDGSDGGVTPIEQRLESAPARSRGRRGGGRRVSPSGMSEAAASHTPSAENPPTSFSIEL
jgi:DNA primase catalytic core